MWLREHEVAAACSASHHCRGATCCVDAHEYSAGLTIAPSLTGFLSVCVREQCQADAALELLAYYSTALPQLMDGLTPQLCQENWGK